MKILTIDIETSPNLAHVWSLWNNNVSLSQLREVSEVLSFAAKWHGDPSVHFHSTFHSTKPVMLEAAHKLMSEADVLVTYNGNRFDIPHLNREFLQAGMHRPAPFVSIDLLKVVKKHFRFVSNKLDHVVSELDIGGKTKHAGHELWVRCLMGDPEAWAKMREYNMHDVELTEQLLDRLRSWITNLPHADLFAEDGQIGDTPSCPNCLGTELQKRGYRTTALSIYQRYYCVSCGTWSSSGKAMGRVDLRRIP